jgi:hypothetical protein
MTLGNMREHRVTPGGTLASAAATAASPISTKAGGFPVRTCIEQLAVVIFVVVWGAMPAESQSDTANQARTIQSVYTPLNLKRCRHTPGKEVEDYGSWQCVGYRGIAVLVKASDQRAFVSYGPNAAKEPAANQTLPAFNSAGDMIEWRVERTAGVFATILRWNTTIDSSHRGQVLVITRLGPGGVCHVGYVDGRANANANKLAAQIADSHARTFRCGSDQPVILGKRGPGFQINR